MASIPTHGQLARPSPRPIQPGWKLLTFVRIVQALVAAPLVRVQTPTPLRSGQNFLSQLSRPSASHHTSPTTTKTASRPDRPRSANPAVGVGRRGSSGSFSILLRRGAKGPLCPPGQPDSRDPPASEPTCARHLQHQPPCTARTPAAACHRLRWPTGAPFPQTLLCRRQQPHPDLSSARHGDHGGRQHETRAGNPTSVIPAKTHTIAAVPSVRPARPPDRGGLACARKRHGAVAPAFVRRRPGGWKRDAAAGTLHRKLQNEAATWGKRSGRCEAFPPGFGPGHSTFSQRKFAWRKGEPAGRVGGQSFGPSSDPCETGARALLHVRCGSCRTARNLPWPATPASSAIGRALVRVMDRCGERGMQNGPACWRSGKHGVGGSCACPPRSRSETLKAGFGGLPWAVWASQLRLNHAASRPARLFLHQELGRFCGARA